jgi:enoyl-CoA hydratase/carnithine racemase
MPEEILIDHHDDGIAIVTLNRPGAMNALSASMRAALSVAMRSIRDDDTVRVVILTGAGDKAFTAGLDLKELGSDSSNLNAATDPDPTSNPVTAVAQCGKPVIGAINGVAITGGFELALACDILIASNNARFADTHALVGVMPGWGLSQKLSRIIGSSRAREMSFSGRFIDADTACAWGLVNRVVPAADLMTEALDLAGQINNVNSAFIRDYRHLMEQGYSMPMDEALEYERLYSAHYNAKLSAGDIEQRRNGVMARGRSQK